MRLVLIGLLLFPPCVVAQGTNGSGNETAGSSLPSYTTQGTLPFSAESQGLSFAGAFGTSSDPVRLLDSPTLLAGLGTGVHLSGVYTPELYGISDISVTSGGGAAGVDVRVAGRPLALVLGAARGHLSFGEIAMTNPTANTSSAYAQTTSVGLGAAWRGPVVVRAGVAGRSHVVHMASGPDVMEARALVSDVGLDVTLPVGERWFGVGPDLRPALDLTAGAAVRGLEISNDPYTVQDDISGSPVQQLILGAAAEGGLEIGTEALPLRAVGLALYLDRQSGEPKSDYDGVRFGLRLDLAETLSVSLGTEARDGFDSRSAFGVGVSLGGLLRSLGARGGNSELYRLGQRGDLRATVAVSNIDNDAGLFGKARTMGLTLRVRP